MEQTPVWQGQMRLSAARCGCLLPCDLGLQSLRKTLAWQERPPQQPAAQVLEGRHNGPNG